MRIFSKIALIFIFSFTISHANDRVDLDIRLEPKSKKNFYSLKLNLENKDSVLFGDITYKIVRSENELFVDEYYDTKLHSLSSKKSSRGCFCDLAQLFCEVSSDCPQNK